MCLFEMVDFADMFGGMGEFEADALAMPAGWKAPAFDHRDLVRHVGMERIVRNSSQKYLKFSDQAISLSLSVG